MFRVGCCQILSKQSAKLKKVLVIGDNLNTDIKGANNMFYDSLFIGDGIHKEEFKNLKQDNFYEVFNKYQVKINYYQNYLSW